MLFSNEVLDCFIFRQSLLSYCSKGVTDQENEDEEATESEKPKRSIFLWFKEVVTGLVNQFLNWKVSIPFVANQMGSLLYYFTLGNSGNNLKTQLLQGFTSFLCRNLNSGASRKLCYLCFHATDEHFTGRDSKH